MGFGCIQTGTILIFLSLFCGTEVGFGECIQCLLPRFSTSVPLREGLCTTSDRMRRERKRTYVSRCCQSWPPFCITWINLRSLRCINNFSMYTILSISTIFASSTASRYLFKDCCQLFLPQLYNCNLTYSTHDGMQPGSRKEQRSCHPEQ